MPKTEFHIPTFYTILDGIRIEREMSWRAVGRELGINSSTFTRLAHGKKPDVDTLATLIKWSGIGADRFFDTAREDEKPVPKVGFYTVAKLLTMITHCLERKDIYLESNVVFNACAIGDHSVDFVTPTDDGKQLYLESF